MLGLRQWALNPTLGRHTNSPPCGFDVGHSLHRTSHELADSHPNTGIHSQGKAIVHFFLVKVWKTSKIPLPAPSGLGVVKMNVNGERKNGSEGAAVDYSADWWGSPAVL